MSDTNSDQTTTPPRAHLIFSSICTVSSSRSSSRFCNMSVPYLIAEGKSAGPASSRIPPIARPFVSDRARKTLDLVSIYAIYCLRQRTFGTAPDLGLRLRNLLKKSVSQLMPSMPNKSAMAPPRNAFRLTLPSWRPSRRGPRILVFGICFFQETTSRKVLVSQTWSTA